MTDWVMRFIFDGGAVRLFFGLCLLILIACAMVAVLMLLGGMSVDVRL